MTYYLRTWKSVISQWRCLSLSCLRYEVRSWVVSRCEGNSCFSINVHEHYMVQWQDNRWICKNFARRFKQHCYKHLVKFYKSCQRSGPLLFNSPKRTNVLSRQRTAMRISEMAQRQSSVDWSRFQIKQQSPLPYHWNDREKGMTPCVLSLRICVTCRSMHVYLFIFYIYVYIY